MPVTPAQQVFLTDVFLDLFRLKVLVHISNTNNIHLLVILDLMTQLLLLSAAG